MSLSVHQLRLATLAAKRAEKKAKAAARKEARVRDKAEAKRRRVEAKRRLADRGRFHNCTFKDFDGSTARVHWEDGSYGRVKLADCTPGFLQHAVEALSSELREVEYDVELADQEMNRIEDKYWQCMEEKDKLIAAVLKQDDEIEADTAVITKLIDQRRAYLVSARECADALLEMAGPLPSLPIIVPDSPSPYTLVESSPISPPSSPVHSSYSPTSPEYSPTSPYREWVRFDSLRSE